jgi:methylphosphotriester-DNA--protein-cysteine methyltransferase
MGGQELLMGVANMSDFNRRFLRLKGLTPRQFRRHMLEQLPDQHNL